MRLSQEKNNKISATRLIGEGPASEPLDPYGRRKEPTPHWVVAWCCIPCQQINVQHFGLEGWLTALVKDPGSVSQPSLLLAPMGFYIHTAHTYNTDSQEIQLLMKIWYKSPRKNQVTVWVWTRESSHHTYSARLEIWPISAVQVNTSKRYCSPLHRNQPRCLSG